MTFSTNAALLDFKLVLDIIIGIIIPLGGWLLVRGSTKLKNPSMPSEAELSFQQKNAKMKKQIDLLQKDVLELQNYRRKITPQIVGLKARGRKKKRLIQNDTTQ